MNSTNYYLEKHPELADVFNKYNLTIKLDDFGMGKQVFYKNTEVGYWFHSEIGIEMQYTKNFGSGYDTCKDYKELNDKIETRIVEYGGNV